MSPKRRSPTLRRRPPRAARRIDGRRRFHVHLHVGWRPASEAVRGDPRPMITVRKRTRVLLVEDDVAWASLTREAFAESAPDVRLEILTGGDDAIERMT